MPGFLLSHYSPHRESWGVGGVEAQESLESNKETESGQAVACLLPNICYLQIKDKM